MNTNKLDQASAEYQTASAARAAAKMAAASAFQQYLAAEAAYREARSIASEAEDRLLAISSAGVQA